MAARNDEVKEKRPAKRAHRSLTIDKKNRHSGPDWQEKSQYFVGIVRSWSINNF